MIILPLNFVELWQRSTTKLIYTSPATFWHQNSLLLDKAKHFFEVFCSFVAVMLPLFYHVDHLWRSILLVACRTLVTKQDEVNCIFIGDLLTPELHSWLEDRWFGIVSLMMSIALKELISFLFCMKSIADYHNLFFLIGFHSFPVCRILHEQVVGVLGPQDSFSSDNVQSICASLAIPHIEARWDYRIWPPNESFSVNVYPDYRALSRAFSDIVRSWQWPSFTILYETNEGWQILNLIALAQKKLDIVQELLQRNISCPGNKFRTYRVSVVTQTIRQITVFRKILPPSKRLLPLL